MVFGASWYAKVKPRRLVLAPKTTALRRRRYTPRSRRCSWATSGGLWSCFSRNNLEIKYMSTPSLRRVAFVVCTLVFWCSSPILAQAERHPLRADSLLGDSPGPFLALSVANLDTMVAWYRDSLGFVLHSTSTNPKRAMRFAVLQCGDALIEILQAADAQARSILAPGTKDAYQIHGFFKSGFVVKNIDSTYQRFQSMGIRLAYKLVTPSDGPYRTFGVRDPEGNLLQFFGR